MSSVSMQALGVTRMVAEIVAACLSLSDDIM